MPHALRTSSGDRVGGSSTSPPITFSISSDRSATPMLVTVSCSSWQIVITTSDLWTI